MKHVVRKTYMMVDADKDTANFLKELTNCISNTASEVIRFIALPKYGVIDFRFDNEIRPATAAIDKDFSEFYDLFIETKNSERIVTNPLFLQGCKTGKTSKNPLEQKCKQMIDNNRLPMRSVDDVKIKYTSLKVAGTVLKSWHECNKNTIENYASAFTAVQNSKNSLLELSKSLGVNLVEELDTWLFRNGTTSNDGTVIPLCITKKILGKFKKYKWTTRVSNYNFSELKDILDDHDAWFAAMKHKLSVDRLNLLRQTAALTLPGNSPRDIPLGDNTISFSLKQNRDGTLVVSLCGRDIRLLPSNYFRNLKVRPAPTDWQVVDTTTGKAYGKKNYPTEEKAREWVEKSCANGALSEKGRKPDEFTYRSKGGSGYEFVYERGNKSPLDENVRAIVKELTIYERNSKFYFGIPLNVEVPDVREKANATLNYLAFKKDNIPAGCRIMGVDLGYTDLGYCALTEATGDGNYIVEDKFVIGKDGESETERQNRNLFKALKKFEKEIKRVHGILDELYAETSKLKAGEYQQQKWQDMWNPAKIEVDKLVAEFRQVSCYNLNKHESAIKIQEKYNLKENWVRGLKEQSLLIIVFNKYLSLLKRWSSLGKKPSAKGIKTNAFASYYQRLARMKKDFRKKFACEIVREARLRRVDVLVIEDLKHFVPDAERSAGQNEKLMLWGKGEIKDWLKHFAEQYGIIVETINPRLTSQTDPQELTLGFRKYKDFYVIRDSEIVKMDADAAASENIAARIHSRGTNEPFLKVSPVQGMPGCYMPALKDQEENRDIKKLKCRFGTHKFIISNGKVVPCEKQVNPTSEVTYLYLIDGKWVTGTEKAAYQKNIEEMVKKLKSSECETSN